MIDYRHPYVTYYLEHHHHTVKLRSLQFPFNAPFSLWLWECFILCIVSIRVRVRVVLMALILNKLITIYCDAILKPNINECSVYEIGTRERP